MSDTPDRRISEATGSPPVRRPPGQAHGEHLAEQPEAAEVREGWAVPPWERPGSFRLDCDPHRARALRVMAALSLPLGLISFYMLSNVLLVVAAPPSGPIRGAAFWLAFALGVPALAALALSLTAWCLSRRDLALMRAGRMDPGGLDEAEHSRKVALAALAGSAACVALWALAMLATLAAWLRF